MHGQKLFDVMASVDLWGWDFTILVFSVILMDDFRMFVGDVANWSWIESYFWSPRFLKSFEINLGYYKVTRPKVSEWTPSL